MEIEQSQSPQRFWPGIRAQNVSAWAERVLLVIYPLTATAYSLRVQRRAHPAGAGRRSRGWLAVLLGFVLLITHAGTVSADAAGNPVQRIAPAPVKSPIAVIYPDIGEPYRTVFTQIIGGIEDNTKIPVAKYTVGQNTDIAELKNSLRQQNIKVVIALGRQGMKIATTLDRNIGVVVGGVIASPEEEMRDLPVNSLSPDPVLMFSHLKVLMPDARRVFAVYDPRQNGWLMRRAKEAAHAQGVELVTYEVQDLRGAVRIYQDIFAAADNRRDALWLLPDSTTAEESSVLPLVLHESWNRKLAVFSSSFGHVRRGVLFSLYPDNAGLGRHLSASALEFLASGKYEERGMILLRDVLVAINLRTANHLGLKAMRRQDFDMVFPEQ
ncbi:MAG: ABC transporter substrate binding protein [Gallionella sp.]|nr:ABC transporter substrate binding protein [Gallionella sp.]